MGDIVLKPMLVKPNKFFKKNTFSSFLKQKQIKFFNISNSIIALVYSPEVYSNLLTKKDFQKEMIKHKVSSFLLTNRQMESFITNLFTDGYYPITINFFRELEDFEDEEIRSLINEKAVDELVVYIRNSNESKLIYRDITFRSKKNKKGFFKIRINGTIVASKKNEEETNLFIKQLKDIYEE